VYFSIHITTLIYKLISFRCVRNRQAQRNYSETEIIHEEAEEYCNGSATGTVT
jgi:hypothetical protein